MSTLKTNNIQHVDRSEPSILINTDGSVNIAGTMTYEDVTNVDAVGIITGRNNIDAQKQVLVGTGVSVKAGGLNVTAGITTVQALQATTGTFTSPVLLPDGSVSAAALAFADDTDTGIFSVSQNTINFATAGVERLEMGTSLTVFNDGGADVNFRIEGDTDENLFHLDASADAIGVGAAPLTTGPKLEITRSTTDPFVNASDCVLRLINSDTSGATNQTSLQFTTQTNGVGSDSAIVSQSTSAGNSRLEFWTDTTNVMSKKMTIDASGRVLINTTTEGHASADNLTIRDTGSGGITIRSGTSSAGNIYFSDATSGSGEYIGYISYSHSTNALSFGAGDGSEKLRIDSNGRLLLGTTTYKSNLNASSDASGQLAQFVGSGDNINHCVSIFAYSGTTNGLARGAKLQFHRSRATDGSTNTAVVEDDLIGSIEFKGNDGTSFTTAASIEASCAGVPGTDDMPGQLRFLTTADGAASPTKRLDLDRDGSALFYHNGTSHLTISGVNFCNGVGASPSPAAVVLAVGRDSGSARSMHCQGHLQFASGYGIDFSPTGGGSNTSGESELFNDYEYGSCNILIHDAAGSNISVTNGNFKYNKIGNKVFVEGQFTFAETGSKNGGLMILYQLPFVPAQAGLANGVFWYDGNSDAADVTGIVYIHNASNGQGYLKQSTTIGQNSNNKYLTFNEIQANSSRPLYTSFSYIAA